jgi:large subunit ribosomal protein L9
MPKNIKLMLTENVDSLGIVGDVVNVRVGYARNFLLPRQMATTPTEEAIAAVAAKRAEAQRMVAEQRKQREDLIHKLEGIHITLVRSCNDLGHLYASVTQQEIATALAGEGYKGIRPRDVRLNVNVKRVDTYDIPIKFEADLEAHIKLTVQPDRKLDTDRHEEPAPAEKPADGGEGQGEAAATATVPEAAPAEKPRKKKDAGEKKAKADRGDKPEKGEAKSEEKKSSGGWGTPVSKPEGLDFLGQKRERRGRK